MFIEALFTVLKIWKQPKSQSTGEHINEVYYIHKHIQWNTTQP